MALPNGGQGTLGPKRVILGESNRIPFFQDWGSGNEFDSARMRWLVALRWLAIASMIVPIVAALEGVLPGVHYRLILGVTIFGAVYNGILHVVVRRYGTFAGRGFASAQAIVDLAMLTAVLYGTGGIGSPFLGYYVFHVALVAILAGPRAAAAASVVASIGALFLILCEVFPLGAARWDPPKPWGTITETIAFVGLLAGTAYIAAHATRDRWLRERDLVRARDRAALDYQLLSNTLDELDAGLEVLDDRGHTIFANRRAEELTGAEERPPHVHCPAKTRGCSRDPGSKCPMESAVYDGMTGRCRFAATNAGEERVYEMLSFPLAGGSGERARVMNLYVDRTDVAIGERKLMVAERLVSLGRIAQGVAHELNTPLATIRTLATDMREALAQLDGDADGRARLVADVDESAALIRDETIRLGKITHALLAGGDLARARVERGVPLVTVVERARALVVAGLRGGVRVMVDPSVAEAHSDVDPDRLMQVMVNLLQNAVDAMRTGGGSNIAVRAEISDTAIRLVVDDDGPGLDPSIVGRLLEPFATTKPPGEGTGLGLYASYMLARTMGGEVSLESLPDRGTRAVITLPVARPLPMSLADSSPLAQRPVA